MNAIRLPSDVDLTFRNWLNASLVSGRSSIRHQARQGLQESSRFLIRL